MAGILFASKRFSLAFLCYLLNNMDMVKKIKSLEHGDPQSFLVRGGYQRTQYLEANEPIYMTSGFVYESAEQAEAAFKGENNNYIYSRYANPSIHIVEEKLKKLEGAEGCIMTATGMAAVYAGLICSLKKGDRVVAAKQLFYSCYYIMQKLLPNWGIETEFVDGGDLSQWEKALKRPANMVFFESPTNPNLQIFDITAISDMAHKAGARVMVDNVFATPCYQRPLELGADIVVYSATKHIDGQGRCLGGAILADEDFIENHLRPFVRHTGPGLSPFNAWLLSKGLETLQIRVDAMSKNTHEIAIALEKHPAIAALRYPGVASHPQHALAKRQMTGFGSLLAFDLKKNSKKQAFKFLNRLHLIDISNNLGDSKSLITHPATTTHSKLLDEERVEQKIFDGTLRLSVGLEAVQDIINDLCQALEDIN